MLIQTETQPCSGNNFKDGRLRESYWRKVGIGVGNICYFLRVTLEKRPA